MDITPEMQQLRSELEDYAVGRNARFNSFPMDPDASQAWRYGWSDVDMSLARFVSTWTFNG